MASAEFAYNNSRSSSTKIIPFKALYGYNPELRFDIDVKDNANRGEAPAAYKRVKKLKELQERLIDELLRS